jgi:hypothetical protein
MSEWVFMFLSFSGDFKIALQLLLMAAGECSTDYGEEARVGGLSQPTRAPSPWSGLHSPADVLTSIQSLLSENDGPPRWTAGRRQDPLCPVTGLALSVPTLNRAPLDAELDCCQTPRRAALSGNSWHGTRPVTPGGDIPAKFAFPTHK